MDDEDEDDDDDDVDVEDELPVIFSVRTCSALEVSLDTQSSSTSKSCSPNSIGPLTAPSCPGTLNYYKVI